MKHLAVLLALVSAAALASSTVTETKGGAQLHAADGSTKYFKDAPGLTAHDACVKAAQELFKGPTPEVSKCWDEDVVTVQATCDDVKAPQIPLTKQADGSWLEPDAAATPVPGSDSQWTTLQWLYIHGPTWPQGFPDCWVRGWADPDGWRVNGTDPNAVFMERIEPGMAALPEPPLSVEPFPTPEPKA